ncbi:carbohydrate ABC transporter permease [Vallitalea maricola]|uniref:Carbohydrate ABC transporter permease n=1 Tax=Vallitalea maricola TaxID=3074433 RepID=A0ACB5UN67_9FIRM|nr:carbohydrate ABC transporter permease [Vallitalea sp. AN17-2]
MVRKKITPFTIFNYCFFVIIGILMFYPFWYVLMYSLSDPNKVTLTNYYFIPNGFTLNTYISAFKQDIIYSGLLNSIIVTVGATAISMFLSVLTAYPLSRENLKGRKGIFWFIMFTMLFNGGMIPTYLVVKEFGMIDSLWSLMLPKAIIVYNLLIIMKFFKNIPMGLIESAKIDGCSEVGILFKIILPLSTSVLATVGLFYAVYNWNAFLPGMMYLNDKTKWTLQVVLRDMLDQTTANIDTDDVFTSPENFKMATVMISVVPILCVYPFLQKYFTKGVMLGSVKG